jgi:hypothetical protein
VKCSCSNQDKKDAGILASHTRPGGNGNAKSTYLRDRGVQNAVWSKLLQQALGHLPTAPVDTSDTTSLPTPDRFSLTYFIHSYISHLAMHGSKPLHPKSSRFKGR